MDSPPNLSCSSIFRLSLTTLSFSRCAPGNVLLLQGKIQIHSDQAFIDFSQLLQLVADYLVESNPPHSDTAMQVCGPAAHHSIPSLLQRSGSALFQELNASDFNLTVPGTSLLTRQISSNRLPTHSLSYRSSGEGSTSTCASRRSAAVPPTPPPPARPPRTGANAASGSLPPHNHGGGNDLLAAGWPT